VIAKLISLASARGQRYQTANSFVADVLREAIVAGILEAGTPLRQDELATALGMSRIPVREALRQLEAEGLIDFVAHKGATVARLTLDEITELAEMRIALESLALRLSVPKLLESDLRDSKTILDEVEHEQDLARSCELHLRFHLGLYVRANRRRLLAAIESLYVRSERYMRFQVGQLSYGNQGQAEHRQLLAACEAGDVVSATGVLERHIRIAAEKLVLFLDQYRKNAPEAAISSPGDSPITDALWSTHKHQKN